MPRLARDFEVRGRETQSKPMNTTNNGPILVTGAAGQLGAVGRTVTGLGVPEHLARHLVAMGELHRAGRYDRWADGVELVTGRPAMSVREFVSLHADEFGGRGSLNQTANTKI